MKFVFKSFVIIVLLLITNTTKAQYLGNYTYFHFYTPFEGGYRFFDSLSLVKVDSSGEYYKKFFYGYAGADNPLNIRIHENRILHKLQKDTSSLYHLLFDMNAGEGDSFYIRLYYKNYYPSDSVLIKVLSIDSVNYDGQMRKTWNLKKFNHSQDNFIDGIGFSNSGLSCTRYGFRNLYYVCNSMTIIHQHYHSYGNELCDPDSFFEYFGPVYSISSQTFNGKLKIYPNPVSSLLNIHHKSLSESSSIRIFNSLGQEIPIHSFLYENNEVSIDISTLPKGMYTIQVDQSLSSIFMIE